MASLSLSATGSGPLVQVGLVVQSLQNAHPVAFRVDALTSSTVMASTGNRLGIVGLMALPTTGAYTFRAACTDGSVWSEWFNGSSQSFPNYTVGSIEASLNGNTSDLTLQSMGIEFPDPSAGSGIMSVRRTLVSKTKNFPDEVRTAQWARARVAFHIVFENLDSGQTELLHRFWRALNGPLTPFYFDYVDPKLGSRTTGAATRYLVRFRDPALADKLFGHTYSSFELFLIDAANDPEGGDV